MSLKVKLLLILVLILSQYAQAQKNQSGVYLDSERNVYVQADKTLYFYIATDSTSKPQRVDVLNKKDSQEKFMQISKDGVHHIKHWNIAKNALEEIIIRVDGTMPKTKFIVSNTKKHFVDNNVCYGNSFKAALSAIDNMSKVQNTYYSINNEPFKEYSDSLSFPTDGQYNVTYYSVDNVGNEETPKTKSFSIDKISPSTKHIIEGPRVDTVFNTRTKIDFTTSDNYVGVEKTYYQIDGGKWLLYKNKSVPISALNDDEHTLKYYSVDKVQNEEEVNVFRFYLDKTPPMSSLMSIGDRFVLNNKVFFSGRTKLVLIALDNKAGIASIMYSIDNEEYKVYNNPFYLPAEQGKHIVKYFAIDKLENRGVGADNYAVSDRNIEIVSVDLLGPDIKFKVIGSQITINNRLIISEKSKIKISAFDKASGLKALKYSIGNDTSEISYDEAISVDTMKKNCLDTLNGIAYDNVNNRNVLPYKFIIDSKGPKVFHYFSVKPKDADDSIQLIPAYSKLFLAAMDNMAGIKSITYSINNGKHKRYDKPITRFVKGKVYDIKVLAEDKLDNESVYYIKFKTY